MQPARVADGTAFAGNTWTNTVLLPAHRTNSDGTQGSSLNWSSSVFTVDAPKAPTGVTITVTPNLGATPPSVTLSMSEATTSLLGGVFRWYLRESVVYGGDVLLWRLVRVAAEGGSNVNSAGSVIQLTVPTAGDVIAAVLPEPTVVQQTGGGGSFPASAAGWLHDDGTGTRAWSTPTAAQVGADTATARDTAISTATAPLATSSALTTGLAGKQPVDADLTTIAALDSAQSGVVASDGAGWVRKTYAQLKTALSITAADVGADTSAARDTAISTAINNLVNAAPGTLDTLGEIATALQADESTAAALATTVAGKQPLDADLTAIAALDASIAGAIASDGAGWVKKTYAQFKTALGLVKADVGLGNVDNTSDVNKPVSTAQAAALAAWPPIQSTAPDPATTHLWIDTTVDPADLIAAEVTRANGAYETVVNHGSTAGTARPSGAGMVLWVGSVAPTNGVAGDQWRDTTLNATRWLVGTAWFYPPGLELGYQERVSNDTTTNTARSSAASNTISGLTVSGVVGTGQPVDIEYYSPAVVHSVAATFVGADLVVSGVGNAEQQAVVDSPVTASGRTLILRRRKILTAGTSYSFDIGKYLGAAGTGTYVGAANQPMHLSVTCR